MFFDALDKLRKKPVHTKQTLALVISGSVTCIIALFWVVSFSGYVSEKTQSGMFSAVSVPFNEITHTISSGILGVQNKANGMFKKDLQHVNEIKATSTQDYSMYDLPSEVENGNMATSTSEKELIQ